MHDQFYLLLVLIFPLASFVLLGLFGKTLFQKTAGIIGSFSLFCTFLVSALTAYRYFTESFTGIYPPLIPFSFTWLQFSENLSIDMGLLLDPISMMMILVVSFISLMVHIFSLFYMKGEERYATYFSFLSLFSFSMLGLVLATNLLQLYIFWELVGVSSFLLIGFYYTKPAAVAAAKKAFIVTRFADLGFLIGILILAFTAQTLDFTTLITIVTSPTSGEAGNVFSSGFLGVGALTWGLSLLFIGGAGKSALFPLHIWLPDAMEGPTPVSALIHAATMVVAGVYLVARLFPLFSTNITVLHLITVVGILSSLFAAVIACTQIDIKRVLAYSTMSQIGFMMAALGVANGSENALGYTASLFHLFTHAFFKSLLFLGAGVIIHFVHSNDIRSMGGLRKLLPFTHACFLVACLAIAGLPPFAGFFSKEEILLTAYQSNKIVYGLTLLISALTAFYTFRLYFSVFWNRKSSLPPHKAGTSVAGQIPMLLLTLCTVGAGFIPFSRWITADGVPRESEFHFLFSLVPVALSGLAIFLATALYKKQNRRPEKITTALLKFYTMAMGAFYIDEVYRFFTRKIIFNLVAKPAAWFDRNVVDGAVNGMASVTTTTANLIKGFQSGRVQLYALSFFGGVAALAIIFIYLWK